MTRKMTYEEEQISYTNRRNRMRDYYRGRGRPDRDATYYRERARKEGNTEEKRRNRKLYELVKKGLIIKPDHCSDCKKKVKIQASYPNGSDFNKIKWVCAICIGLSRRAGPNEKYNKHSRKGVK